MSPLCPCPPRLPPARQLGTQGWRWHSSHHVPRQFIGRGVCRASAREATLSGSGTVQDTLRIAVREERRSHSVTRTATFNSLAGQRRVFFEISGDVLPPPLQVHDFAVLSALIVAMREGRPVHVEGPVTEALIRGLEEFQEAWALWRTKYTPVRITADQIVPVETASTRRGMFAFSGGVDGTFALLRHHKARAGLRTE